MKIYENLLTFASKCPGLSVQAIFIDNFLHSFMFDEESQVYRWLISSSLGSHLCVLGILCHINVCRSNELLFTAVASLVSRNEFVSFSMERTFTLQCLTSNTHLVRVDLTELCSRYSINEPLLNNLLFKKQKKQTST